MAVNPAGAISMVSSLNTTSSTASSSGKTSSGTGFGDILSQAVGNTNQLLNQANQMASAYAAGANVPIDKVMIAEQQASLAVDLTVQVRDKMVSAYQSVMNMQI